MKKPKLIDCPYYKEFDGFNCWGEHSWDDYPCHCQVPGEELPLCNPDTNGWKRKKFIAKVGKDKLEKALESFRYAETLLPENIVKRLDAIESQMEGFLEWTLKRKKE